MAEVWQTPRRCEKCFKKGITEFMMAQSWGTTIHEVKQYKLDCHKCGFSQLSLWNGHGGSDGRGMDGSDH